MANLNNWQDLYLELVQKIQSGVPTIKWIDLWHNQINFLTEEHPFPSPAAFILFRILDTTDIGQNIQEANLQVDLYYFYETFSDTFDGSYNQTDALEYLSALTAIHKTLHGTSGDTYSEMRRISMEPVDTGSSGNLYRISFTCLVTDISAATLSDEAIPGDLNVSEGTLDGDNEPPLFNL